MTAIDRNTFRSYFAGKDLHVADANQARGVETSPAMQRVVARVAGEDGVVRGTVEVDQLYDEVSRWFNDRPASVAPDNRLHMRPGGATERAIGGLKLAAGIRQHPALAAKNSLVRATQRHADLVQATGVGTHYGDQSAFAKLDAAGQEAFLANQRPAGAPVRRAEELTQSSCVHWAMEHVGAYYHAAGKSERWAQIEDVVKSEGLRGTSLARELQEDGWKVLYNNPDTSYRGAVDKPDGEHAYSRHVAENQGTYYGIPIDGMITDWQQDPTRLSPIENAPFFVHIARGGTHVTAGVQGQVNELARNEGPNGKMIYQDPMRNIIDEYTKVYDGPDARDRAMRIWGSGVTLLPPGTAI